VDQGRLKAEAGIVFAVRRVEADYLSPARFDDMLEVETEVLETTAARVVLSQRVLREGTLLFASRVTIVALTETGRPARLPAEFRRALDGIGA
jgi:acyl-CoA thioester hydrolase